MIKNVEIILNTSAYILLAYHILYLDWVKSVGVEPFVKDPSLSKVTMKSKVSTRFLELLATILISYIMTITSNTYSCLKSYPRSIGQLEFRRPGMCTFY